MTVASSHAGPVNRPDEARRVQLAQQILRIARNRGWRRGHHLVEQTLVDTLRVSRSPIRGALRLLESRGLVEAHPNRGFFLACEAAELKSDELDAPLTQQEQLYVRLIEDRLASRLPERFTQAEVMRDYKVGRAALTMTLVRMTNEGLLTRNPGQGWSFEPSLGSLESRESSYIFRLMIEPRAILLPTFAVDRVTIGDIRREHMTLLDQLSRKSPNSVRTFQADARFHEAIAAFSRNPFVVNAVRQQNRLRRLLEFQIQRDQRRIMSWCQEHLDILSALERRQLRKASRLMREHLENARAVAAGADAM